MINLPLDFVKTKYPGYFWSTTDKWLYSCKSGILKRLAKSRFLIKHGKNSGEKFNGWCVSHLGEHKYLPDDYFKQLSNQIIEEFPVVRAPLTNKKDYSTRSQYTHNLKGMKRKKHKTDTDNSIQY